MANNKCVSLLLLVVVATSAQCGLGFRILDNLSGTDSLQNNAGDMTIRNLALSGTTPQPDLGDVALPLGRSYEYLVVTDITSVTSWLKMTNATGSYDKQLLSWSSDPSRVQPVPCGPDCQWTIDPSGFSVLNPATQQVEFVVGWDGPLSS